MNAIISKGDRTAHVQLSVGRKQLSGALSYLGANHTSDYDLKYNEKNKDGLKVHSFVYKHGAAPRKTAVKGCSHHRQGISLSPCLKTRIDFEETCDTDRC